MEAYNKHRITYTIIAVNVLIFLVTALLSGSIVDMNLETLVKLGAIFGPLTVVQGEWWRVFTAMFLHGGMTHLLMNMFSLYIIGRGAESYFDTRSYLVIYLFSGLIGGLVSIYMHPASVGVGASGAIFGIFGALAGFFIAHRERIGEHTKSFMKDFAVIIGINMVIGFSIEEVDVSAHVAGLIVGFIGGFIVSKDKKMVWFYSVTMVLVMVALMNYLPGQYAQRLF